MSITSRNDLIAGMARRLPFGGYKASVTAEGAGTYQSLWKAAGGPIGAGATPSTGNGDYPTRATAGAWGQANATGGRNLHLSGLSIQGATIGRFILADILWWDSGFDCTVLGPTSIGTPPTLPARGPDVTGAGVELWGYFWAAPGATTATFTAAYTDQDGNSANATYVHPGNAETINQMVPFVLADGDYGVRTVSSLTLSGSTAGAGDFGFVLLRRIAEIDVSVAAGFYFKDWAQLGLPRIYDDACLALICLTSTTSTGAIHYGAQFAEN